MNTAESSHPPGPLVLAEVRYALPEMLAEIRAERATSAFAMEKLDQSEIKKLFKAKSARAKSKK